MTSTGVLYFTENILNSLNPTGTVVTDYSPELRMTATLGKNITTLDKTSGKSPDELITIYRGAPNNSNSMEEIFLKLAHKYFR